MKKKVLLFLAAMVFAAASLQAVTIYPLDKAEILAGARFDFKVEFDEIQKNVDVDVTINGKNYSSTIGRRSALVTEKDEAGMSASALIVRDVTLPAGKYVVSAAVNGKIAKSVTWTVNEQAEQAVARNVIVLVADGLSIGHRTAARLLSRGNVEGTSQGLLNMDKMDRLGTMGTSSVDAITVDSANSMSAYMTGHKSSINALGVYADRTSDPFDDPKQENLAEIIRRTTKKSIGIVSDAELQDATPAAVVGHTRRRAEKSALMSSFLDVMPEVILGGGSAYFIPKSVQGSKRTDEINYVSEFQKAGYQFITSNTELSKLRGIAAPDRLLGLFATGNMDGHLDRTLTKGKGWSAQFTDQPDLTTMTQVALDVLSKNKEGFMLVVEAALVDKYTHPMDWERAVYDTIMFDKVIGIAQDFQKENPDTLIVVTGDHTHSISVYGTVNDDRPGDRLRDKVGTYANAGFPNYVDADGDGYPDTPDVSIRLAVGFGNHPDYYETFKPHLDGVFAPAIANEKGDYVANAQYKDKGIFMEGNLDYTESQEVHSVDDQLLSMSGPGSEQVKAYQENTAVFHYIAQALGLQP